jgi:cytochrome c-type biogenesis protein CcmF
MIPMVVFLPLGAYYRWNKDSMKRVLKQLLPLFIIALLLSIPAWWFLKPLNLKANLGLFATFWIAVSVLYYFKDYKGKLTRAIWGMQLAHIGVAVYLFGVTMTEHTDFEIDTLMNPGETKIVQGYSVEFKGVEQKQIENYNAHVGHFVVSENNDHVADMNPQKRIYARQANPMTEAAIDPGFTRDLYISLGEQINDKGGWGVRIYIKPFIRWMWAGGLLMMLGGFWAATDRRYFRHANAAKQENVKEYLKQEA